MCTSTTGVVMALTASTYPDGGVCIRTGIEYNAIVLKPNSEFYQ
jgi:hypothetical protein